MTSDQSGLYAVPSDVAPQAKPAQLSSVGSCQSATSHPSRAALDLTHV
jgi:hypothetical protein